MDRASFAQSKDTPLPTQIIRGQENIKGMLLLIFFSLPDNDGGGGAGIGLSKAPTSLRHPTLSRQEKSHASPCHPQFLLAI